jgi:NAD(P)-dependent dehydrogenase (short-subunit alcohol dehydrogenase family)
MAVPRVRRHSFDGIRSTAFVRRHSFDGIARSAALDRRHSVPPPAISVFVAISVFIAPNGRSYLSDAWPAGTRERSAPMTTHGAAGIAVVTGASRGIGRAVAIELAARGLDVVATMRDPLAGRSLLAEAEAAGLALRVERLDVRRVDEFAVPEGLRVLVNSAGVRLRYLPVEETPLDEWRETFETNVFGLVELTRRALPTMRRTAEARGAEGHADVVVCNVSSSSILLPHPFMGTYRASKAAVSALCDSLRIELAPFGIRVVEILPGPIGTDLLHDSVMVRPP